MQVNIMAAHCVSYKTKEYKLSTNMSKNFILQNSGYLSGFHNAFLGFRPIDCSPCQPGVRSLQGLHPATV